VNLPQIVSRI